MEVNSVENYEEKRIIVLGLAKSGTTIAKILHRFGADVTVNDAKPEDKCPEKKELEKLGIKVICGRHPEDLIDENVDLVVKNPGIPYSNILIEKAVRLNIPVITEVEIASKISKAPIIGITGSNGKTTTTTLIGEIIKKAGLAPIVAGNIGTVLSEEALLAKEEQVLVAELSSFQLKGTINFRPHIAVLLNIYPAHLDYHQSIEDYIDSKSKLFCNQNAEDYAVLNAECETCINLKSKIKSQIYLFSTKSKVEKGAYIEGGKIFWVDGTKQVEILSLSEIFLKGAHLENVLAAIVATRLYGVDFEAIRYVLRNFKGVEHRLEYVLTTNNNIIFYNDSKATNPQATITALSAFEQSVILIAGGLDRGISFEELIEPFKKGVKFLITFGQTAEKLKEIGRIAGIDQCFVVDNVNEAVKSAYSLANNGDIVLLSPACASWDMFTSFEERGRMFKEAVHKYKNGG
ncbi:UDP-N-acetylmuramoylalanine--D-glutamate ligase [Vulcanibacillus modesticaldus]|uniref:UDP-N-acetylmuramoylalanine--D-glutamate ligase n=1 Tax=Vulcanibacillus modesticaldus TaxID=337097 RepID=A0A1D2YV46_9BACI|nr:UDP-N-acetylmuramoyl-L-alanine--D-glutamate ligase [Vulcanibacillus modesticaldus]OEF99525.1 UDP-N-acetylmuramoylalanine--D-glutamate ligase [Vulcanibacillus modesticaldus]